MIHWTRFIIIASTLLWSYSVMAQDAPKVGLVLSGGGAKGMAHIGVIKVLEELGIVPDYITGTSMGAVVGGLYATGYSAAELEEIALTADWDVLLGNQIPYQSISVEQKPFYGRSQLVLPVENFRIGLPKGVIEGQELYELLVDLTAPVHAINDFDSLPRPFRCIGADIVTGEKVVLSEGFLPEAIRASMAIPSIFTPVEIDGHLLVDGGLIHNFPAIEAVEMGADIIIGVSVSDSLVDRSQLNSLVAILSQATFIGSVKATEQQKQYVDYFIRPSLYPYSTGSFGDGDSIIVRGENAARDMYAELKNLADSLKALRTFEEIHAPEIDTMFHISEVRVRGNENIPSVVVQAKLGIEPGDSVSREDLSDAVTIVYGTLGYDRVTYDLDFNTLGTILTVNVKETTPGQARFNLHYDTENGVGLMTTLQFRGIGFSDSRLVLEADIAETPYFLGEYSVYLGDRQRAAASIGAKYFQDNLLLFNNAGDASAAYRTKLWRYFLNFNTTRYLDRMLGIQFYSDIYTMKPTVASDENRFFSKLRYSNFGSMIYWTVDKLDRRLQPRHGMTLKISGSWNFYMQTDVTDSEIDLTGADPDYQLISLDIDYQQYIPLGDKWTFWTGHLLRLTNTKSDKLNVPDWHFMGGFRPHFMNTSPFWGAEKYQFQLTSFYKAAIGFRYEIVKNLSASIASNYVETEYPMRWLDSDEEFFDRESAAGIDRRLGFLVDLTYVTRVGPIRFSLAKDIDNKQYRPWFSIGYNFAHDPSRRN